MILFKWGRKNVVSMSLVPDIASSNFPRNASQTEESATSTKEHNKYSAVGYVDLSLIISDEVGFK